MEWHKIDINWKILNNGLRLFKQSVIKRGQIYRIETVERPYFINQRIGAPVFETCVRDEKDRVVEEKYWTDIDEAEAGHTHMYLIYSAP